MTKEVINYSNQSPIHESLLKQLSFEGADQSEKFISLFTNLYKIDLYKDGLDLILTKSRQADLKFEIKLIKGWDTNVGCYLTEQNKVYNKFMGVFTNKLKHKIIIRSLAANVMAHEMAHALEIESGLVLNEDFRKAIGFDMKNREPSNLALKGEIKRIMVEGLKPYPAHQIISELFARYFELLSVAHEINNNSGFGLATVMEFFENTTNWITKVFNSTIRSKIDSDIANYTHNLILNQDFGPERKFTNKVDSFYKRTGPKQQKSWSLNVKTNAAWQESWNKYKQIEKKDQ